MTGGDLCHEPDAVLALVPPGLSTSLHIVAGQRSAVSSCLQLKLSWLSVMAVVTPVTRVCKLLVVQSL